MVAAALIAAFLARSPLYLSVFPPFEGWDEPQHLAYIVHLDENGAIPVMNAAAYRLALKTAVALHCEIPARTKWDRKQYYYPDLPKGYQISQYDLPMSQNGFLDIEDAKERFAAKRVRIIRAHLEEDAGKSLHDEAAGRSDSQIDLNRTGTPLLDPVDLNGIYDLALLNQVLEERGLPTVQAP